MKRLAFLWFACATVGFAVAAGTALAVSFAVDGGGKAPAHETATRAQPGRLGAAATIVEGRRLLGD